jgi:hypothetical protein
MTRKRALSVTVVGVVCLVVSLATWVMPPAADAGGVHFSIGIGVPAPVYVAPPPVVVQPAPVFIQPAPGVVYPPPVGYTVPYGAYGYAAPPVIVKPYRGYHRAYAYKFYKHGKPGWWHHRHDD